MGNQQMNDCDEQNDVNASNQSANFNQLCEDSLKVKMYQEQLLVNAAAEGNDTKLDFSRYEKSKNHKNNKSNKLNKNKKQKKKVKPPKNMAKIEVKLKQQSNGIGLISCSPMSLMSQSYTSDADVTDFDSDLDTQGSHSHNHSGSNSSSISYSIGSPSSKRTTSPYSCSVRSPMSPYSPNTANSPYSPYAVAAKQLPYSGLAKSKSHSHSTSHNSHSRSTSRSYSCRSYRSYKRRKSVPQNEINQDLTKSKKTNKNIARYNSAPQNTEQDKKEKLRLMKEGIKQRKKEQIRIKRQKLRKSRKRRNSSTTFDQLDLNEIISAHDSANEDSDYDAFSDDDVYFEEECKSVRKCVAIKRIILALEWYSRSGNEHEKLYKKMNHRNYGQNLMNDYNHILEHHLNGKSNQHDIKNYNKICKEVNKYLGQCSFDTCHGYRRYMRSKKGRCRHQPRTVTQNELMMFVNVMDSIHCCFMHLKQ